MNRAAFLAATAAATAAPTTRPAREAPIVAEVTLQRDATDLLAPFVVAIALNNTTGGTVRLEFPTADLFRIDVLRDDSPVWSSLTQHKPIPVNRQLDVPPGRTKLASMTIDGTTDDRRAYAPGKYTVRVAMLGTSFGMVVDKQIEFGTPLPIDEALRAKPGSVLTIAGEQTWFRCATRAAACISRIRSDCTRPEFTSCAAFSMRWATIASSTSAALRRRSRARPHPRRNSSSS